MEKRLVSAREELESIAATGQQNSIATHEKLLRISERMGEELAKHIAPPGGVPGLSPLMDKRRLEFSIPNEAFDNEAVYDRVFLYQIPRVFGDKFEGTSLYMPETVRQRNEEGAPRGIIITAGMKALDNLRSNGMDIGHIVTFVRLSPWRLPYVAFSGIEMCLMVLRDGDIISSEDLVSMRRANKIETRQFETERGIEHRLCDPNSGLGVRPQLPWIPDDM